jgi:hypothetical protein
VAKSARLLGHKISKFSSPSELVFDNITQSWYQLDTTGGKQVAEPPQ